MATPVDTNRLKSWLANSKMQQENNALYQCIFNLITAVQNNSVKIQSLGSGGSSGPIPPATTLIPMTTGAIPAEILFTGADVMLIRTTI